MVLASIGRTNRLSQKAILANGVPQPWILMSDPNITNSGARESLIPVQTLVPGHQLLVDNNAITNYDTWQLDRPAKRYLGRNTDFNATLARFNRTEDQGNFLHTSDGRKVFSPLSRQIGSDAP